MLAERSRKGGRRINEADAREGAKIGFVPMDIFIFPTDTSANV